MLKKPAVTLATVMPLLLGALACEDDAINANAIIEVEPAILDFGKVATGRTRTLELRVKNRAAAGTLEISRFAFAAGTAETFSFGEPPTAIEPGQSIVVPVTFTPDGAEPDAGHIEIDSNALGGGRLQIPLRSDRTFAKIRVDPPQLDLGSLLAGGVASGRLTALSVGDATLLVHRISLRTEGFAGEACEVHADCREGECTSSGTGRICALPCSDTCAQPGYSCTLGDDGYRACREDDGIHPPTAARGFTLSADRLVDLEPLLPEADAELALSYRPEAQDRGSVQVALESNDADQPFIVVPILGLADNLPPVATATVFGPPPDPIEPGTRIALTGEASFDPEGEAVTHRWRFIERPENSRAAFEDATASQTAFTVDLPGRYIAFLEARDASGLTSTNDARVEILATSGSRVRVELSWDQAGSDLDLHFVSPGAPVGSVGDCYFENQNPDWGAPGPESDPVFTQSTSGEQIAIERPADGVYTLLVNVVSPSPVGATAATLRIFLEDVEVASYEASLPLGTDAWDVATLAWPQGVITTLGTIR